MQYSVYSILVACVAMCAVTAHANDMSTLYDVLSKRAISADECKVKYGEAVESLFDRVCEVCHSMFAHEAPNLRLNCR
jgi:cytochrome c5